MSGNGKHAPIEGGTSVVQRSILSFFGKVGVSAPRAPPAASRTPEQPSESIDTTAAEVPILQPQGTTAIPVKTQPSDDRKKDAHHRQAEAGERKAASASESSIAAPAAKDPKSQSPTTAGTDKRDETCLPGPPPASGEDCASTPCRPKKEFVFSGASSDAPSPETDLEQSPQTPAGGAGCRREGSSGRKRVCPEDGPGSASRIGEGSGDKDVEVMTDNGTTTQVGRPNKRSRSARRGAEGMLESAGGGGRAKQKMSNREQERLQREGSDESDEGSLKEEEAHVDCGRDESGGRDTGSRASEGTVEAGGTGDETRGGDGPQDVESEKHGEDEAAAVDASATDDGEMKDDTDDEEAEEVEQKDEEYFAGRSNGGVSEVSDYELRRLERIKKNQAFMATLGLAAAKPVVPSFAGASGRSSSGGKKRSRPVSRTKERAPVMPVRRSARARGAEAVDYSEHKHAIIAAALPVAPEPQPAPVLEEIDFDDSTVLKYLCGEGGPKGQFGRGAISESAPKATSMSPEGAKMVGLRMLEPDNPLSAHGLSTIYSMHFCGAGSGGAPPPLLAAGGKGGVVALFSTQLSQIETSKSKAAEEDEDERTLMNFKAHKGWVSAVRFVEGGGRGGAGGKGGRAEPAGGFRLLTSANDSVVKLWDTSKQHGGFPRLLCTADDLHPTRKGIFSMDSRGVRVATGSKDTTVALASLRPTGLALERVLGGPGGSDAFHVKVIKGVSLRDENTVASCGDDSNVRVSDLRSSSSSGVSHRLDGVHEGSCHTARWHPRDANLLLTAGLDSTVKLFDLRQLASPLHVFRGHCPYALARPRAIHRPEFLPSGQGGFGIVTCGERSDKLSMYDSSSGATVSRGVLGGEASALAVRIGEWSAGSPGEDVIAAAMPGGSLVLLGPVWESD